MQQKYEVEIEQLKESLIALTKENEFYFDKLRRIEKLCQNAQNSSTTLREEIMAILYEVKEGFAIFEDDPQVPAEAVGSNPEDTVDLEGQRSPEESFLNDSETY
ncbi:unnamed protein product [Gongylonema pulchrum]|uniref:EB1 C-terminal domain-containing protein n=1 Tax=Gongylonema pulchrum TaxID=637853 RepID=A0A183DBQ3_9BILA|nr:unnamed protein product [Gongylonema pulchrum]